MSQLPIHVLHLLNFQVDFRQILASMWNLEIVQYRYFSFTLCAIRSLFYTKLELNFREFLKNCFPIKIMKLIRNTVLIKV
jgi:hypothetical protein